MDKILIIMILIKIINKITKIKTLMINIYIIMMEIIF